MPLRNSNVKLLYIQGMQSVYSRVFFFCLRGFVNLRCAIPDNFNFLFVIVSLSMANEYSI